MSNILIFQIITVVAIVLIIILLAWLFPIDPNLKKKSKP